LLIEKDTYSVTASGIAITLNPNEFDVLVLLADNVGQIVGREILVSAMRGIEYDGFDRSIDIRVSRLRRKLAAVDAANVIIKTIRGKGYMLLVE